MRNISKTDQIEEHLSSFPLMFYVISNQTPFLTANNPQTLHIGTFLLIFSNIWFNEIVFNSPGTSYIDIHSLHPVAKL